MASVEDETTTTTTTEDDESAAEAGLHNEVKNPANDPVLGEGEEQDPVEVGRVTAQENVAAENAKDAELNDGNKQL
jgi:hypothetical protein